jgi:hypothetical protein
VPLVLGILLSEKAIEALTGLDERDNPPATGDEKWVLA